MQIHPITKSDFSYYFIDELIDRVESVGVEIGGSRIRSGISQIPKGMSISEAAEELDSLCSSRRLYIAVDLVVAAPKSVSILWALSTDTIRRQIEICHEKALCRALEYYEVTENWTSSKGEVIGGSGVTAYEFRHRISRSADPHLHSHVVLLNATQYGNDIKALNLTRLRRALPALEALYRFEFAQVLFETTGFSLRGEILGTLLLPGLNETAIDQFSKRRREVLEHAQRYGLSRSARKVAAVATRTRKEPLSLEDLGERWKRSAREVNVALYKDGKRPYLDFCVTPIFVSPVPDIFHSEFLYTLGKAGCVSAVQAFDDTCRTLLRSSKEEPNRKDQSVANSYLSFREVPSLPPSLIGSVSQQVDLHISERFRSLTAEATRKPVVSGDRERIGVYLHGDPLEGKTDRFYLARTKWERRYLGEDDSPYSSHVIYSKGKIIEMESFSRLSLSQMEQLLADNVVAGFEPVEQRPQTSDLTPSLCATPLVKVKGVFPAIDAEIFLSKDEMLEAVRADIYGKVSARARLGLYVLEASKDANDLRSKIISTLNVERGLELSHKGKALIPGELVAYIVPRKGLRVVYVDPLSAAHGTVILVDSVDPTKTICPSRTDTVIPVSLVSDKTALLKEVLTHGDKNWELTAIYSPLGSTIWSAAKFSIKSKVLASLDQKEFYSTLLILKSRLGDLERLKGVTLGFADEDSVARSVLRKGGRLLDVSGYSGQREIERVRTLLLQRGIEFKKEIRSKAREAGELGISRDITKEMLSERSLGDRGGTIR